MKQPRRLLQVVPQADGRHLAICDDGTILELARNESGGPDRWIELPQIPQSIEAYSQIPSKMIES